jgi:hypothetical protein
MTYCRHFKQSTVPLVPLDLIDGQIVDTLNKRDGSPDRRHFRSYVPLPEWSNQPSHCNMFHVHPNQFDQKMFPSETAETAGRSANIATKSFTSGGERGRARAVFRAAGRGKLEAAQRPPLAFRSVFVDTARLRAWWPLVRVRPLPSCAEAAAGSRCLDSCTCISLQKACADAKREGRKRERALRRTKPWAGSSGRKVP